jgi:tetratricopeptide (TPR) repeat protein
MLLTGEANYEREYVRLSFFELKARIDEGALAREECVRIIERLGELGRRLEEMIDGERETVLTLAMIYYHRGRLRFRLGNTAVARGDLESAKDLISSISGYDDREGALAADIWQDLGLLYKSYADKKTLDLAISAFDRAEELDGGDITESVYLASLTQIKKYFGEDLSQTREKRSRFELLRFIRGYIMAVDVARCGFSKANAEIVVGKDGFGRWATLGERGDTDSVIKAEAHILRQIAADALGKRKLRLKGGKGLPKTDILLAKKHLCDALSDTSAKIGAYENYLRVARAALWLGEDEIADEAITRLAEITDRLLFDGDSASEYRLLACRAYMAAISHYRSRGAWDTCREYYGKLTDTFGAAGYEMAETSLPFTAEYGECMLEMARVVLGEREKVCEFRDTGAKISRENAKKAVAFATESARIFATVGTAFGANVRRAEALLVLAEAAVLCDEEDMRTLFADSAREAIELLYGFWCWTLSPRDKKRYSKAKQRSCTLAKRILPKEALGAFYKSLI